MNATVLWFISVVLGIASGFALAGAVMSAGGDARQLIALLVVTVTLGLAGIAVNEKSKPGAR